MLRDKIIVFGTLITLILIVFVKAMSNGAVYCPHNTNSIYKSHFMTTDGRIVDFEKGNITTSEGQSYIMLRSVLTDDKHTFDIAYKWTTANLKRNDNLFSWLWGKNNDGDFAVLDKNSASDADVDISFALILAYEKWNEKSYLNDAIRILDSIWNMETKNVSGHVVLMPGINQTVSEKNEINPSYFSPYEFKVFAKYDKKHDWNKLVNSSYFFLEENCKLTKSGLPSDWFLVKNGKVILEEERSNFSYDAIRTFPRIYLDYRLTNDKRALKFLEKSKFFLSKWKNTSNYYTAYNTEGDYLNEDKFIGGISVILPAISIYKPSFADKMYKNEVLKSFNDKSYWYSQKDYYGKNLIWFGCYLYDNLVKNYDRKKI